MASFKSGSGAVTLLNSAGLLGAVYYFHGQTVQLRSEIEALRRQLSELRSKVDKSERDTRKEFKHLRKELAVPQVEDMSVAAFPPAAARQIREADLTWGPQLRRLGQPQTGGCPAAYCQIRQSPSVKLPVDQLAGSRPGHGAPQGAPAKAKLRKSQPVPLASADLDALSQDL